MKSSAELASAKIHQITSDRHLDCMYRPTAVCIRFSVTFLFLSLMKALRHWGKKKFYLAVIPTRQQTRHKLKKKEENIHSAWRSLDFFSLSSAAQWSSSGLSSTCLFNCFFIFSTCSIVFLRCNHMAKYFGSGSSACRLSLRRRLWFKLGFFHGSAIR